MPMTLAMIGGEMGRTIAQAVVFVSRKLNWVVVDAMGQHHYHFGKSTKNSAVSFLFYTTHKDG